MTRGTTTEDFERELHVPHLRLDQGPAHPAARGSVRFALELDGEVVVDLATEIGFLHRGFEKECESGSWLRALPYVERLNGGSAALASTAFCLAVEKLMALETPIRAQWLRVLVCELARAGDHATRIAALCQGLQATTAAHWCLQAREGLWDLQEALSGARVTSGFLCLGGVKQTQPAHFAALAADRLASVRARLGDVDGTLGRSSIFVDRLRDTGVLSAEDCLRYGVTGPLLRAAGVGLDLRKAEPYLVYDQLEFEVPVGEHGDNYDRYLVCLEEVRQSLRIVEQCIGHLEALGSGAVRSDDARVRWPGWATTEPDRELALRGEAVVRGPRVAEGESYFAVESANGELGFYVVADGTARPYKVRCRAPSFANLQPLPHMLRGGVLSDLVPTFDLLNCAGEECDR